MHRHFLFALGSALALFAFSPASTYAGIVVDQSQWLNSFTLAQFGQGPAAQSFQQSLNNITGVALETAGGPGQNVNVQVQLFDAVSGGNLLGFGQADVLAGETAFVDFSSPIFVTPDTDYFLFFSSTTGDRGLRGAADAYSRGTAYTTSGGVLTQQPGFDFTFQTFGDDAAVAAPEPSTLVSSLVVLGLAGLTSNRRRRTPRS